MKKTRLLVGGFLLALFTVGSAFGYSGGSGTAVDPYLIANQADLLELGANTADYSKHFKLTADIDLAGTNFITAVIAPDTSVDNDFQGTQFTGVLDGNHKKILNLTIDGGSNSYLALFGEIGTGAEVRNLGVVNSSVMSSHAYRVAGFCASNYGSISGCYAIGSASGGNDVAGLCARNAGSISHCYAAGEAKGADNVGGICGYNAPSNSISSCYSTASVNGGQYQVGGFCGWNDKGSISESYSTGLVSSQWSADGFCGHDSGTISSSFWDTETSGQPSSYGGIGKTTAQMQTQSIFTDAGWDFANTWAMHGYPKFKWQLNALSVENGTGSGNYMMDDIVNISADSPGAGYAFLGWSSVPHAYTNNITDILAINTSFTMPDTDVALTAVWKYVYSGGSGIAADPYLIANQADLLELGANTADYDKHFKMTANIDLAATNFATAVIAPDTSTEGGFQGTQFTGVFDGNDKEILNLTINGGSNQYLALFGEIGAGAEVRNLGVVDCSVQGNPTYRVAGFCASNYGSISRCYATGSASGGNDVAGLCARNAGSISYCYAAGEVNGLDNVAGICGYNALSGSISSCYSTASVHGGEWQVGGFCGWNKGSISESYSTGLVSGELYPDGFCGHNNGTISSCFWDTETSGQPSSYGGTGKTTAQMQTQSTFTDAGWDFVDTWAMNGYPVLREFMSGYPEWLIDFNVPAEEQAYTDCHAGDGIQNLLKYAMGLNPMEYYSTAAMMQPVMDQPGTYSIIYNKAKETTDVDLFPEWTDSLMPADWSAEGFEFRELSDTSSNVTWKATHSATGECGFVRLKAQMK